MAETLATETGWLSGLYWPVSRAVAPLEVNHIYELILTRGVQALWQSAVRCPCNELDGNLSHRPDCPVCGETNGWIFVNDQTVRVLSIGFTKDRDGLDRLGDFERGRVSLTVRAEHSPTFMDRLILLDARSPFRMRGYRRATLEAPIEPLPWPIVPKVIDLADTTTLTIGVEYLIGADADGVPMAPLVEGEDYDVVYDADGKGRIDWTKGDEKTVPTTPAPGSVFAARYQTRPVLRVLGAPHAIRDTRTRVRAPVDANQPLPVQFGAQLEWMVDE